jgi:hypothetical protein
MLRRLTGIALALAVLACSKPQPSPEYEQARTIWNGLVKARTTDAATDPQADEVLALLARVPKRSLDYEAATALTEYIQGERKTAAEAQARRAAILEKAGQEPAMPSTSGGGGGSGDAVAAATGGGPASWPASLAPGMKLEEFQASYGPCFHEQGPAELSARDGGSSRSARVWSMNDTADCREKHGDLVGKIVLFADGQLASVNAASDLKKVDVKREVQLGSLPDGGVGMRVDGGVVPLPPGATLQAPDGGGGR